ncbi:MAG: hypothetical protein K6B67_06835 [Lachnospiraceae bacterium]|nr:hypothetical protein [Lachnospiraceae bacterium]
MRLISCHITGFGKIENFDYDFTDDFQIIMENNGWGKTTFAAFLKAMFFGMEYSRAYKTLNERRHYKPWNNTVYGGNLVFELSDKKYRIERIFGDKDTDDTFALYDVNTGLKSDAFSENLGEEIFQVDRESFEKSIFIPEAALHTEMTDSLNAKMGNIASVKDDINNFDAALDRVEEAKKKYTRKGSTNNGLLNVIKDEITECQSKIEIKAATLDGHEKIELKIKDDILKQNWIEAEKRDLSEKIAEQSKREQQMGAYKQQKEYLAEKQEAMEELDDFFAKGMPTLEEHAQIQEIERQYDICKRSEKDLAITMPVASFVDKWNRLFEDGIPDADTIESWRQEAIEIQTLTLQGENAKLSEDTSHQLMEYKFLFSKKEPTEEELESMEQVVTKLTSLEGRILEHDEVYRNIKAKKEAADTKAKESTSIGTVFLLIVLGVAFTLGGLAVAFWSEPGATNTILQVVAFAASVGCIVAAIMQLVKNTSFHKDTKNDIEGRLEEAREALEKYKQQQEELRRICNDFLSNFRFAPGKSTQQMIYDIRVSLEKYRHLLDEERAAVSKSTEAIEKMSELQIHLYTKLEKYAAVYEVDLYHEGGAADLIEKISADIKDYRAYLDDKEQLDKIKTKREEQKRLLDSYFARFPLDETASSVDKLGVITTNIDSANKLQQEIEDLEEKLKKFVDESEDIENEETVEQLQEKQSQVEEQLKEIVKALNQDIDARTELLRTLDEIDDAENRLEVLEEKKAEADRRVGLYNETEKYLKLAKENFLAEYMQPLREGMDRYLEMLDKDYKKMSKNISYEISMDLEVKVIVDGGSHNKDYLSRGYQDLVALCARFALVDVLYDKEKPMIILDDPFTNFDKEKIERALNLLKEISQERQIIYFTCHESRALKR